MNRNLIVWSFTRTLTLTFLASGVLQSAETEDLQRAATIKVDLQQPGAAVPAGLYGIFMEEINQGFDGGIYAELIRNRSFEEGVLPPGMRLVIKENGELRMELEKLPAGVPQEKWEMPRPWFMNCGWDPNRELVGRSLTTQGGASGKMETTAANPMNVASSRSLKLQLDAGQGDGAAVSLVNEGYWGINVVQGQDYDLTFYLRPGTFVGKLMVTLQSVDGTVLAMAAVTAVRIWRSCFVMLFLVLLIQSSLSGIVWDACLQSRVAFRILST